MYDAAVTQTGCSTPLIVENELYGAGTRDAVVGDERAVPRERPRLPPGRSPRSGAHPVLLISGAPYTGGDAVAWWQQVAQVADIVREVYVPATLDLEARAGRSVTARCASGTARGSPTSPRSGSLRADSGSWSASSRQGDGGRNGLSRRPRGSRSSKWYALAAKQVAGELGLGTVCRGAGRVEPGGRPRQADAACVWLWAREREPLRRAGGLGEGLRRVAERGPDQPSPPAPSARFAGTATSAPAPSARSHASPATATPPSASSTSGSSRARRARSQQRDARGGTRGRRRSFGGSRARIRRGARAAHANADSRARVLADEMRRARLEQRRSAHAPTAARRSQTSTVVPAAPRPAASQSRRRRRGSAAHVRLRALRTRAAAALLRCRPVGRPRRRDDLLGAVRRSGAPGPRCRSASLPLRQARPRSSPPRSASFERAQRVRALDDQGAARTRLRYRDVCLGDDLPSRRGRPRGRTCRSSRVRTSARRPAGGARARRPLRRPGPCRASFAR